MSVWHEWKLIVQLRHRPLHSYRHRVPNRNQIRSKQVIELRFRLLAGSRFRINRVPNTVLQSIGLFSFHQSQNKNTLFSTHNKRESVINFFTEPHHNTVNNEKQKKANQNIPNHDSNEILESRIRSQSYHHIVVEVIIIVVIIITVTKIDKHYYWQ